VGIGSVSTPRTPLIGPCWFSTRTPRARGAAALAVDGIFACARGLGVEPNCTARSTHSRRNCDNPGHRLDSGTSRVTAWPPSWPPLAPAVAAGEKHRRAIVGRLRRCWRWSRPTNRVDSAICHIRPTTRRCRGSLNAFSRAMIRIGRRSARADLRRIPRPGLSSRPGRKRRVRQRSCLRSKLDRWERTCQWSWGGKAD
jgi:hypothetical protein